MLVQKSAITACINQICQTIWESDWFSICYDMCNTNSEVTAHPRKSVAKIVLNTLWTVQNAHGIAWLMHDDIEDFSIIKPHMVFSF